MSSQSQTVSSVKWTALSMLGRAAIAVLQLAILARILPTSDFGLLAQAMTAVGVVTVFSDFGLGSAVIHHRDLSEDQLSSLFWLGAAFGVSLFAVMAIASIGVASFYQEPELVSILTWLGVIFVFSSPGVQLRAMAERDFRFKSLATVELIAAAVGLSIAVLAAFNGLGVYSLVVSAVAVAAMNALGYWLVARTGWTIRLRLQLAEVTHLLRFGLRLTLANLANTIGAQADLIVGGRLFSSDLLGLYAPPRELTMRLIGTINPIVTRVSLPLVSSHKADRSAVARIYASTVLMTSSVNFPLFATIAAFPEEIAVFVLGDGWAGAGELLRAAAIWCLFRSIGNPVGSLLAGVGHTRRAMISSTIVTLLAIAAAYLGGTLFGMVGIPYSLAALYAALVVPLWYFVVSPASGIGFVRYHEQLLRPAIATAIALIPAYILTRSVQGDLARIAVGCVAVAIVYVGVSAFTNPELNSLVRSLAKPSRKANK